MAKWVPVDGDIFVTNENFVFYALGYDHPRDRVFAFLKYIPSEFELFFPLRFLKRRWRLGREELLRPEKIYTEKNYSLLLMALKRRFPYFVYLSPYLRKEVICARLDQVKNIFVPRECLQRLLERRKVDQLQKRALDLICLFSETSGVPLKNFGIHGSIALNMHTMHSDIDLVVYGANNFRTLEKTIDKLVDEGTITYVFTKKSDILRKSRCKHGSQAFGYTAIRNFDEISNSYGEYLHSPIKPVTFHCQISGDHEAMFRPANYQIENYEPTDSFSEIGEDQVPTKVVSMIGCYRNMARIGETLKVSGMLEKVEKVKTKKVYYQVVVGTATRKGEYISLF